MRVTNQMLVDQSIASMNQGMERLGQLQGQAATGKQFQAASDVFGSFEDVGVCCFSSAC